MANAPMVLKLVPPNISSDAAKELYNFDITNVKPITIADNVSIIPIATGAA